MHNRFGYWPAAILMVLHMACADASPARRAHEPLPESALEDYRRCERDDQCAWVNNGCCDCANGGADIAVRADALAAFRARFQCDRTPCTAIGAIPACGTGTVACERGRCVYRAQPNAKAISAP